MGVPIDRTRLPAPPGPPVPVWLVCQSQYAGSPEHTEPPDVNQLLCKAALPASPNQSRCNRVTVDQYGASPALEVTGGEAVVVFPTPPLNEATVTIIAVLNYRYLHFCVLKIIADLTTDLT